MDGGTITPIGIGVTFYWGNLISAQSGISSISRFDTNDLQVKITAEDMDY